MFGFSLTKLVFTAVIVFVVWNAFKYFTRVQDERAERSRVKGQKGGGASASKSAPNTAPAQDGVEDMVECKVCKAYVARGSKSCGRDDCPYSG